MGGKPRYVENKTRTPHDPNFLVNAMAQAISSSSVASRVPTNNESGKQYIKARNGIVSGAFGSVSNSQTITTGILDITEDSTGDIPIRRTLHINPETGTTGTLIGIETDGLELPYQEMILLGVSGDTITITHNSGSVSGTQKAILCPGDVNYSLAGDEGIYLVYDTSVTSWIITGATPAVGSGMNDLVDDTTPQLGGDLDLNGNHITATTGEKYFFDGGTDTYMTGSATSGRIDIHNNTTNVSAFLTSGFLTTNITCSGITSTGSIDIDGNLLYMSPDKNTWFAAATNDIITVATNSTTRMFITNSDVDLRVPLTMTSNDITGVGELKFSSTGTISGSDSGISLNGNDIYLNVASATTSFYRFRFAGSSKFTIHEDQVDIHSGHLKIREASAPIGTSNSAKIFAVDSGGGKTVLKVQFGSGSAITLATEA